MKIHPVGAKLFHADGQMWQSQQSLFAFLQKYLKWLKFLSKNNKIELVCYNFKTDENNYKKPKLLTGIK